MRLPPGKQAEGPQPQSFAMSFNEYDNPFAVRWRLARHAVPRRSICLIVIIFDIVYCLRASAPPLWRWQMELQEEEAEEAAEEARVEAIEKMGAGARCRVQRNATWTTHAARCGRAGAACASWLARADAWRARPARAGTH